MGLRETLEAATPGPWRFPAHVCWFWGAKEVRREPMERFEAQSEVIALAPELAALVLDMGAFIEKQFGVGGWLKDESQALLARLDQLGAADETQHGKEQI